MLHLFEVINSRLNEAGYNVFFNKKNEDTEYPFIIFNFPNSTIEGYREDVIMEVDIWTKDVIQCMKITNIVNKKLNRFKYIDDDIQVSIYKINQLNNIPDDNIEIERNQLRYIVKHYNRKE